MDGRIPEPVQPILQRYLQLVQERLPGLMAGFYLHGSIALDAYNARLSDVDFVTLVSRRPDEQEGEQLRAIRQLLQQEYPRLEFDGIYVAWEDLGRAFEQNPVTWWILKKRGITVLGPPAETLPVSVDEDWLLRWMKGNLNSFWAGGAGLGKLAVPPVHHCGR